MRVLQVCPGLDARFGGTASSCAQLANHLVQRGIGVTVATAHSGADGSRWPLDDAVARLDCGPVWPSAVGYVPALRRMLRAAPRPDIVHLHGLWRVYFDQAARFAREIDARVVVTTHGMLYEHNLAQRPLRKRAARWLYQDRVLHEAACLHATADEEAEGIRRHGFEAPIAVLPWGVDVPPGSAVQRADRPRTVVYMGRLHPLKRLDTLVRAWAAVQANAPGWSLAFAGAAEQGYDGTLEALAADAGVAATVRFDGLLHGAARERAFADAAVVVQPSPAENFSLAIAEALSRGVPAIATHGAPWRALEAQRCGWWIEPGAEPLARALREAIVMSDDERRAMGERARRYARAQFDWETVADRTIEMYEWTLGRGSQPEFVHSS